jgi:UDP-3-O-[3-hydroxymyristoyl] glucosamine N-acyltransferase
MARFSFLQRTYKTEPMPLRLSEIAAHTGARLIGNDAATTGVASIASARAGDLVFIEQESRLSEAIASAASAIVAGEFAGGSTASKPLLISAQPRLTFAKAAALILPVTVPPPGIHLTAVVHDSAILGKNISIAELAVIGRDVEIGDNTSIGAGCVLSAGVKTGSNCRIYPNVTIYSSTTIGNRVVVHGGAVLGSNGFGYVRDEQTGRYFPFPQVGRLAVEDDVEIGANSTIDRGALDVTIIRRGTKIDNLVHVGHNVDVGEDVVIAAQTGISGSTVVERNAIVGGQVGIADHVRIEEGAILGAQSGIPSNKVIRGKGVVFWGTPARPIREYLKELALLSRLAKKK